MYRIHTKSEMPLSRSNTGARSLPATRRESRSSRLARTFSERLRTIRDYTGGLSPSAHAGDSTEERERLAGGPSTPSTQAEDDDNQSTYYSMDHASINEASDYDLLNARLCSPQESSTSTAKTSVGSSVVWTQAQREECSFRALRVVNGAAANDDGYVPVQPVKEMVEVSPATPSRSGKPSLRRQWRQLTVPEREILRVDKASTQRRTALRRQMKVSRIHLRHDHLTLFDMVLEKRCKDAFVALYPLFQATLNKLLNWISKWAKEEDLEGWEAMMLLLQNYGLFEGTMAKLTRLVARWSNEEDLDCWENFMALLGDYGRFHATLAKVTGLLALLANEGDLEAWDYMMFLLLSLEQHAQMLRCQSSELRAILGGLTTFPSVMGQLSCEVGKLRRNQY